jgi:DNA-binding transcriptional ArsR family regulator
MLDRLTISDEKAATAFANARTRAIVFALMESDRSLSELRSKLGMSLSLLQYHIARLQFLGIVTVSSTKQRPGRAIKMYRAVAREFRVPGGIAASTAGAGLKQELEIALEEAQARRPTGAAYFLDEGGTPQMRRQPTTERGPVERWCRLRMSPGEAAKLSLELGDLLAKYDLTDAKGRKSHLCYFALVKSEQRSRARC